MITSPAPPAANLPAFIRCQSVAKPLTARILMHRRDDDAVLQGDVAQLDRREQQRVGHALSLLDGRRLARRRNARAKCPASGADF